MNYSYNVGSVNSVVQRWCNFNVKPHPRYLECGFMVTPTGFKPVTF